MSFLQFGTCYFGKYVLYYGGVKLPIGGHNKNASGGW